MSPPSERAAADRAADGEPPALDASCFGDCRDCGRRHALPPGQARAHARALMRELEAHRRLDYTVPAAAGDPRLAFDVVFAGDKGNMFGVLECRDDAGRTVVLRSFSSLPWGTRAVAGWVPPLLSEETFEGLVAPGRRDIERMTRELETLDPASGTHRALAEQRRCRSRELLEAMHDRYELCNFRGERRPLRAALAREKGIPGGVGECCAPKLLHHAAIRGLHPVGLAEFYWGGERGARGRRQGQFYAPCETRCQLILGFLLCGLDDDR